ncbi:MAG: SDR family oxidoreductase [Chitinophagales bacterium]|nr:SDR family oxidoreductase [Chitinophagales bacterium]
MENKTYLIIGASAGIGFEITRRLSAQGARVLAYSRRPMPEQLPGVEWQALDVLHPDFKLENLPEQVHGFVYCPGSINLKSFSRVAASELRDDLEINVVGAFRTLQQVYPALRASGSGSAVLFSSVVVQTGMMMHASIATAKGAVEGLTRSLAAEWAPTIRINTIAPSLTDTPLAAKLLSSDEKRQNSANRHPLKRVGTPADMAATALFLLSDSASFITGQVIHVDGGMGTVIS